MMAASLSLYFSNSKMEEVNRTHFWNLYLDWNEGVGEKCGIFGG